MARPDWKEEMDARDAAVKAWAEKFDIGPGMNDGWRGRGDPPPTYKPITHYSGRDGWVGKGWEPILYRLAEDLIALGWDRQIRQVKEKLGGLRFYIRSGDATFQKRIEQAEDESYITCEECGAPGVRCSVDYWIKTECPACNAKRIECRAEEKAKLERSMKEDEP